MIRICIIIDCDHCRAVLEHAVTTTCTDTVNWQKALDILHQRAQYSDWYADDNSTLCPDCVSELEREAQYFQQQN